MTDSPRLRTRAARIHRVVDWGHRWAAEWHKLASALLARGINIYG